MIDNGNIIRKICNELGMTYKQLGEKIGYAGDSLNAASNKPNDKLSMQLVKAIELYLENLELRKELEDFHAFKRIIRDIFK